MKTVKRIPKDLYYLYLARVVAMRSTCLRKHYGAVLVKDDHVLSTGYNGSPRGECNCCDTGFCYARASEKPINPAAAVHGSQYGVCVAVHAEQNAIINAGTDISGATLYLACYNPITHRYTQAEPCNICERMLKNAGIAQIITEAFVNA